MASGLVPLCNCYRKGCHKHSWRGFTWTHPREWRCGPTGTLCFTFQEAQDCSTPTPSASPPAVRVPRLPKSLPTLVAVGVFTMHCGCCTRGTEAWAPSPLPSDLPAPIPGLQANVKAMRCKDWIVLKLLTRNTVVVFKIDEEPSSLLSCLQCFLPQFLTYT